MIEHWTELIVGVAIIISPWVLGFSDISVAKWCNVLLGLTLVVVNAWMIFGESPATASMAGEPQKRKRKSKDINVEQ